jgi:hypothetical protein
MCMKSLYLITLIFLFLSWDAHALKLFAGAGKRQSSRTSKRWTLASLAGQKKRVDLMDQWLVFNNSSGSLLEFYLGGEQGNDYKYNASANTPTALNNYSQFNGAFFFTIFGLKGESESSDETYTKTSGSLMLRFLGNSIQTTNMVLGMLMTALKESIQIPFLE